MIEFLIVRKKRLKFLIFTQAAFLNAAVAVLKQLEDITFATGKEKNKMKDLDILIAEKHEAVRKIENADNNIDKLHHFGTYLNILS